MEADAKIASALALRLKLMSGLDISEKRLPQDGRFAIKVRNTMVDVRISTMPTQCGESVVMRLLNQNTGLLIKRMETERAYCRQSYYDAPGYVKNFHKRIFFRKNYPM